MAFPGLERQYGISPFASLAPMKALRRFRARRHVARVVVGVLAALIMLAMHESVAGASPSDFSDAPPTSSAAGVLGGTEDRDIAPADPGGWPAGECGLAVLCIAALGSLGALILLSVRRRLALLWSAPRAGRGAHESARARPLSLSFPQRSLVLRC